MKAVKDEKVSKISREARDRWGHISSSSGPFRASGEWFRGLEADKKKQKTRNRLTLQPIMTAYLKTLNPDDISTYVRTIHTCMCIYIYIYMYIRQNYQPTT